jgi:hypothetical protein
VPSTELPDGVGRDIRDDVCRRGLDVSGDELGGEGRNRAEAALLPRAHERPYRPVVGDRRAGTREREPASRAFPAPLDVPRGRGAAESAARAPKRPQLAQAGPAERVCRRATADAGARKEKVDEPRRPR